MKLLTSLILILLFLSCSQNDKLVMEYQVTGSVDANCYLIYSSESKEAALIDVAGPIDSLLELIDERNLKVKYFLFTHGHFDHVMGLPEIKERFQDAKVSIHKDDYDDMLVQLDWVLNNLEEELLEYIRNDPKMSKMLDFNATTFPYPNIFIEDKEVFRLGSLEIKAIQSPGHSRGSVCYYVNNSLFTGDVLFYRTVGRTDVQNSSREDQIKSVRNLYQMFPDSTIVYPGHGEFTLIGNEKRENKKITSDGGEWIAE